MAACLRALTAMRANVDAWVPNRSMCAWPAPPKNWAAIGASAVPWSWSRRSENRPRGEVRSDQCSTSAPFCICSKPKARTTSAAPLATVWRASHRAEEPEAQLLLTFTTGMPVVPTWYSAAWPAVESP